MIRRITEQGRIIDSKFSSKFEKIKSVHVSKQNAQISNSTQFTDKNKQIEREDEYIYFCTIIGSNKNHSVEIMCPTKS